MDIVGEERGRLERIATWLEATRAELAALALLLTGAVVATGLVWWSVAGGVDPPAPVAGIEQEIDPDDPGGPDEGGGGVPPPDAGTPREPADEEPARLTVHVTGAVASPGLVTLAPGGRVADAVELAGGATDEGELHRLNLARPVGDGEQIHVPRAGEQLPPEASGAAGGGAVTGPVDLNRADAATLQTLPGIGPARAEAIIEHREANGPFGAPGDLRDVPGIGEVTFQRLAEDVTTS